MRLLLILLLLLSLAGCQSLMRNATSGLALQLGSAVENHDDPETVAAALPAYLLLLDGLIEGDPDGAAVLMSAARLYATYAGSFVSEPDRTRRLAVRALSYAERAFCPREPDVCRLTVGEFSSYESAVGRVQAKHGVHLLAWSSAWAAWMQAHSDDWDAIANIPRVRLALEKVQALRAERDQGVPELYLGVLNTLLPEAYGGRPEEGRRDFERAIALSQGRNHMARVLLAERYARLTFNRKLHDQILREALVPPAEERGFRLSNRLAAVRARELLASADDYFGDFDPNQDFNEDAPPW